MSHVQILAKRCRLLIYVLAGLSIIAVPALWLSSQTVILTVWEMVVGIQNSIITLTPGVRFLGVGVTLLPLAVILYICSLLLQLFKNYEQLNLFSLVNARLIRKLGFSLYLWAISNIVFETLFSLVLTYSNPPHEKILSLTLSGADILSVIIGSIVILLSWVMIEAEKIAEDNALIP